VRTTVFSLLAHLTRAARFPEPIIEFGAARVEAQAHLPATASMFSGQVLFGSDMQIGPGVDHVQDLHAIAMPSVSIGTALVLDTVEHVREPWRALAEVHRCLKPGGLVVMTSHFFFPIHAFPDDYWRFSASGFEVLLSSFHTVAVDAVGSKRLPHTVIGVAVKPPVVDDVAAQLRSAVRSWHSNGSTTWKERALMGLPPPLLISAYDAFSGAARFVNPRRARRQRAR